MGLFSGSTQVVPQSTANVAVVVNGGATSTTAAANAGTFLGLQAVTLKMITIAVVGTLVVGGITAGVAVSVLVGN